jgi:hypothetical protein
VGLKAIDAVTDLEGVILMDLLMEAVLLMERETEPVEGETVERMRHTNIACKMIICVTGMVSVMPHTSTKRHPNNSGRAPANVMRTRERR